MELAGCTTRVVTCDDTGTDELDLLLLLPQVLAGVAVLLVLVLVAVLAARRSRRRRRSRRPARRVWVTENGDVVGGPG